MFSILPPLASTELLFVVHKVAPANRRNFTFYCSDIYARDRLQYIKKKYNFSWTWTWTCLTHYLLFFRKTQRSWSSTQRPWPRTRQRYTRQAHGWTRQRPGWTTRPPWWPSTPRPWRRSTTCLNSSTKRSTALENRKRNRYVYIINVWYRVLNTRWRLFQVIFWADVFWQKCSDWGRIFFHF